MYQVFEKESLSPPEPLLREAADIAFGLDKKPLGHRFLILYLGHWTFHENALAAHRTVATIWKDAGRDGLATFHLFAGAGLAKALEKAFPVEGFRLKPPDLDDITAMVTQANYPLPLAVFLIRVTKLGYRIPRDTQEALQKAWNDLTRRGIPPPVIVAILKSNEENGVEDGGGGGGGGGGEDDPAAKDMALKRALVGSWVFQHQFPGGAGVMQGQIDIKPDLTYAQVVNVNAQGTQYQVQQQGKWDVKGGVLKTIITWSSNYMDQLGVEQSQAFRFVNENQVQLSTPGFGLLTLNRR